MKIRKITKLILLFFILLPFRAFCGSDEKNNSQKVYENMALEISSACLKAQIKTVAILPFSYVATSTSAKDGYIISERLLTHIVKLGRVSVVERSQLEKILKELKFENSGEVDVTTAKNIGKVLGADGVITGTLVKTTDWKIEVNARLIETENARAIAAFSAKVNKDWLTTTKEKEQENNEIGRFRRRMLMQTPAR